jgi:aryl-alcohol dehydrogenase-like predicted oxidoreductase
MVDSSRRAVLRGLASVPIAACGSDAQVPSPANLSELPNESTSTRTLGRTGAVVDAFSLGGEGILRTVDREREAIPVILEALTLGVRYFDTAPAYAMSQDYYGAAFREAGKGARDRVFLATKTHARERDAARALLDDSLRRLGTDRVDLWQLHDLRTRDDLDRIFAKDGAIEAATRAKEEGTIRFIGITGHHDPAILVEAMRRFEFDTVLAAMNPSDSARAPFLSSVIPEARRRGMGVVGMKSLAVGRLVRDGVANAPELLRYAATFADTVIIGCSSVDEVRRNFEASVAATRMTAAEVSALEARVLPTAHRYDTFKAV